jgi:hypothetical protein
MDVFVQQRGWAHLIAKIVLYAGVYVLVLHRNQPFRGLAAAVLLVCGAALSEALLGRLFGEFDLLSTLVRVIKGLLITASVSPALLYGLYLLNLSKTPSIIYASLSKNALFIFLLVYCLVAGFAILRLFGVRRRQDLCRDMLALAMRRISGHNFVGTYNIKEKEICRDKLKYFFLTLIKLARCRVLTILPSLYSLFREIIRRDPFDHLAIWIKFPVLIPGVNEKEITKEFHNSPNPDIGKYIRSFHAAMVFTSEVEDEAIYRRVLETGSHQRDQVAKQLRNTASAAHPKKYRQLEERYKSICNALELERDTKKASYLEHKRLLAGKRMNDFIIGICKDDEQFDTVRTEIEGKASMTGHVFQEQSDCLCLDVEKDLFSNPKYKEYLGAYHNLNFQSAMATCLIANGYRIAVLMATSSRKRAFTTFHLDQFVTAGQDIAPYIADAADAGVFGDVPPLRVFIAKPFEL